MKQPDPRWKVGLRGEEKNLKLLAAHFSTPEARITEEKGNFFISSSGFDELTDSHVVVKRAEELLGQIIPAMGFARSRPLGEVSVDAVTHEHVKEGKPRITHHHEAKMTLALQVKWNISPPTLEIPPSPPDSLPETLVALATNNGDVRRILALCSSKELNFVQLYKILEVVEKAAGGGADKVRVDEMDWCTKTERDRFTVTANDPILSGDQARHAVFRNDWSGKPMSIAEARAFIRRMVRCLVDHLADKPARKRPKCIGIASSGIPDLAERDEEYMDGFGEDGLEDYYVDEGLSRPS